MRREISLLLARRMLHRLKEEAANARPGDRRPELRVATERHWLDLDRPEGYRTVHAVVKLSEDAGEATRDRAKAIRRRHPDGRVVFARGRSAHRAAPRRGDAPQPPPDPAAEAFISAAKGVAAEGLEVRGAGARAGDGGGPRAHAGAAAA